MSVANINAESSPGAVHLWGEIERIFRVVTGEGMSPVRREGDDTRANAIVGRPEAGVASLEAIHTLRDAFGLTQFELDLLLLCVGRTLNGTLDAAYANPDEAPTSAEPTFRLAFRKLDAPHWSVLSRARPLRMWDLIEIGAGPILDAPLRIQERVLNYLLEIPTLDEKLDGLFRPLPAARLDDAQIPEASSLVSRALAHWTGAVNRPREPLHFHGGAAAERASLFRAVCKSEGLLAWEINASDIPENPSDRDRLARAWTRESVLAPAALLIRIGGSEELARVETKLAAWLDRLDAPIALDSTADAISASFSVLRLTLPPLNAKSRTQLWQQSLGPLAASFNGQLERMVEAFPLDSEQIRVTSELLREQVDPAAPDDAPAVAWQLCREQARRPLDQLAIRIESLAEWDDLILPEAQMDVLRQIAVHAREAATVNVEWGFSGRHSLGRGLSALFSGASGTGKTMAAGILARTLDRDLYQIDLSTVVSKYIGDTERHLRKIFEAAEQSGAILLFDEADALFGMRSQVKDSHDRYANLEISYLLQRMESYSGIALLTTNMQHALDPAFVRRLRFIMQFPIPGPGERLRIWQRIFPAAAPTCDLDFHRLAQLDISGGVIRNIAFHAAFLAAGERDSIRMSHILRGSRTEYGKMDKPLNAAEIRGWL